MATTQRSRQAPRTRKGASAGLPKVPLLVVLALLVVTATATWLVTRPSGLDRRIAELEAQSDANGRERTVELLEVTSAVLPDLQAVVDEMYETLPTPDGPASRDVTEQDVESWRTTTTAALGELDAVGTAGTEVNVARNGIEAATRQLVQVVDQYAFAMTLDADQATAMLPLIAQARLAAVEAWSVAATQVDFVSVLAEQGHAHLYLVPIPGQAIPDDGGEQGDFGANGDGA